MYQCEAKKKSLHATRSHTYVYPINIQNIQINVTDLPQFVILSLTHPLCIIHWSILRMPVIHSELSQSVILNDNDTNSIWNADYGIQNIGITHFDGQILTFDLEFYIDTLVTDVMILFQLFAFFFIRFDSFF